MSRKEKRGLTNKKINVSFISLGGISICRAYIRRISIMLGWYYKKRRDSNLSLQVYRNLITINETLVLLIRQTSAFARDILHAVCSKRVGLSSTQQRRYFLVIRIGVLPPWVSKVCFQLPRNNTPMQ